MRANILSGDIRDEFLVPVALPVQDESDLLSLLFIAVSLRSEKDPELKRHIESGEMMRPVQLRLREIMDTKPAFGDDAEDLLDPDLASVVDFQGTPRLKPAVCYREDDGLEEMLILKVERAVDENAPARS